MAHHSDITSDLDSDIVDSDDDEDNEEFTTFRGPWFNVVDPNSFIMPDPDFREETGPVSFYPGMSALEYFTKFLHYEQHDIVDILVRETNRYADQELSRRSRPPMILGPHSRFRDWCPVTRDEMLAFLGIVLSMGVVKKSTYESYWESNTRAWSMETPNFSKIMARNRFQAILQFLHCNDNAIAAEPGDIGYDPLHKISPIIEILNETFSRNYKLNRDVCVDERIVGFKGRHQLKQYISNKKAHRWGIKLWVLSDSTSGYTHHLNIYKGRRNERRSPNGQGYQAVMDLMEPHFYKEHHITFDSFFTSPKLVYDLLDKQTHSTGTVIKSRKDMPSSFKNAIMQKGDVKVKTRAGVMAVQWADRRVVSLLTTTGSARQIQTTNGKGREVSIPAIIDTYNLTMGGVDLGDQLILQFEPQFKSLKMWRKLLFHSLVTAAVNAYICYRDSFIVQHKMDHLKFHQQLCQELIGGFRQGSRNRQLRIIPVQHRTLARLSERHFPSKIPDGKRKRCAVCAGHGGGFRKTRIQWWCEDCRVGLCVEGCFRKFHTRINFEE